MRKQSRATVVESNPPQTGNLLPFISLVNCKQMWYKLLLNQDEKYYFFVWNFWDLGVITLALSSLCRLIRYIMKTFTSSKFQTYKIDMIHIT